MESFSYYGDTNPGQLRDNNEDFFVAKTIWDEKHFLGIVIDGVGGYEGGEVASSMAAEVIETYLLDHSHASDSVIDRLKQAVTEANNQIDIARNKDKFRPNMSCVLSAAILDSDNNTLSVVHIGDTRIYQFCRGELLKITHDHSLVGYLEDIGEISEQQAMNHPHRNIIERALGDAQHLVDDRDFLEATVVNVEPGTRFLFCSDGLTDMIMSLDIITELVNNPINDQIVVSNMISMANNKGGKDNITVIVLSTFDNRMAVVKKDNGQTLTLNDDSVRNQLCSNRLLNSILLLYVIMLFVILLRIVFLFT